MRKKHKLDCHGLHQHKRSCGKRDITSRMVNYHCAAGQIEEAQKSAICGLCQEGCKICGWSAQTSRKANYCVRGVNV